MLAGVVFTAFTVWPEEDGNLMAGRRSGAIKGAKQGSGCPGCPGRPGALCLGSVGAVIGATVGSAFGLCLGAVPALFTFGLSLPVGAVLGGAGGVLCGALTGSSAGFVREPNRLKWGLWEVLPAAEDLVRVASMFFAYFRREIRSTAVYVSAKLHDVYDLFVARPTNAVKAANRKVRDGVRNSAVYTKDKAKLSEGRIWVYLGLLVLILMLVKQ
eukprot:s1387_g6.t1